MSFSNHKINDVSILKMLSENFFQNELRVEEDRKNNKDDINVKLIYKQLQEKSS